MSGCNIFSYDIIVSMLTHAVAAMYDGIHMFPRPWRYFLPIPPHIWRVWIFEEEEAGITTMVALDWRGIPACLFYITNVLYEEVMRSDYGFYHHRIPWILPQYIFCRFHPSDLICVWWLQGRDSNGRVMLGIFTFLHFATIRKHGQFNFGLCFRLCYANYTSIPPFWLHQSSTGLSELPSTNHLCTCMHSPSRTYCYWTLLLHLDMFAYILPFT